MCGRKSEGVEEALRSLAEFDSHVKGVVAHVGRDEAIGELIAEAEAAWGAISILVNNAGTNPYSGTLIDSEDWAWDKTFAVNLRAPYRLSREVAKTMRDAGGGAIINIASVAGLSAALEQGIYSVTKAGLIMLTKAMALEMGEDKIRVNAICPGVIKTKLSEALWKDEAVEKHFAAQKALRRVGETDEIVGAAIYLASEASSFTTGAILQVDGGMVI